MVWAQPASPEDDRWELAGVADEATGHSCHNQTLHSGVYPSCRGPGRVENGSPITDQETDLQNGKTGNSLAVLWSGLCFHCRGPGFDPSQGTKIPQVM